MLRVILESPWRGDDRYYTPEFQQYARECMEFCLDNGAAPIPFHLLYTQVLDDTTTRERELGMKAAQSWYGQAEEVWVFEDFGISDGMLEGIRKARQRHKTVKYFKIREAK